MGKDFQEGEIIIYTSEDGSVSLDTKLENETIWLTQDMMTKLFETTKQNISLHINNIYKDEELDKTSTVKEFFTVRKEGNRTVSRNIVLTWERRTRKCDSCCCLLLHDMLLRCSCREMRQHLQ